MAITNQHIPKLPRGPAQTLQTVRSNNDTQDWGYRNRKGSAELYGTEVAASRSSPTTGDLSCAVASRLISVRVLYEESLRPCEC